MEKYREIVFNGSSYVVSNYGNIKSKTYLNNGRIIVDNKNSSTIALSRIVAKAFPEICGEWFDGCVVHHKDHNQLNNRADNLEILTKEEHIKYHQNSSLTKEKLSNSHQKSKSIAEYDDEWNLIKIYNDIHDLESKKPISVDCLRQSIRKSTKYKGHYWLYLD